MYWKKMNSLSIIIPHLLQIDVPTGYLQGMMFKKFEIMTQSRFFGNNITWFFLIISKIAINIASDAFLGAWGGVVPTP